MATKLDLDELKSKIDLRVLASNLLGKNTHHSHYDVYSCFKHSDSTPSLTVWSDHFYCFSCKIGGSVFDFLMQYKGITIGEAIKECSGEIPLTPPPPVQTERATQNIPMSVVQDNAQNILDGLPYFESRGIKDTTSYNIPLGVNQEYKSYYHMSDDTWIEFRAPRYAVPNIFDNKVRAINYRRNDAAFLEAFFKHPAHGRVMDDLKEQYETNDNDTILKFVAGSKYKQHEGSQWKPFNVQRIAKRENGETTYIYQPYLLLHAETKEFDTLGVEGSGYPCVGVVITEVLKPVLPKLFAHIPLLYIIRDNDDAGLKKAVDLQNLLGRGRIIQSPQGKDSGDAIQAGLMTKWMSTLGLEPILNGS